MKDINEVLRRKEADLQRLEGEVEALRIAARVLEETESATTYARPAAATYASSARPAPPSADAANPGDGALWDTAAKEFP